MDLNLTLLGEMLTFLVLVWFTLKFIWPPLLKAMKERQEKIAEGLAAAERGHHSLKLAQEQIVDNLREAKSQASVIIEKAREQGGLIVENEKLRAKEEGERVLNMAKKDIEVEISKSQKQMQKESAELAVMIAEKILKEKINLEVQDKLLDELLEK